MALYIYHEVDQPVGMRPVQTSSQFTVEASEAGGTIDFQPKLPVSGKLGAHFIGAFDAAGAYKAVNAVDNGDGTLTLEGSPAFAAGDVVNFMASVKYK